jgi:uncharacterized ubiquitin-like protein YukD
VEDVRVSDDCYTELLGGGDDLLGFRFVGPGGDFDFYSRDRMDLRIPSKSAMRLFEVFSIKTHSLRLLERLSRSLRKTNMSKLSLLLENDEALDGILDRDTGVETGHFE